jgi:hypothetical protein
LHPNERKLKFCKDTNCWEKLCDFCAKERHADHNVIDLSELLVQVKTEKEKKTQITSKLLSKYKKLLNDFESTQRKFFDLTLKVEDNKKKLKLNLEQQLTSFFNEIDTQQNTTKHRLNEILEDVNVAKLQLTKDLEKANKLAEQILISGDINGTQEFFEITFKQPANLKNMAYNTQFEFKSFQEIEQDLSRRLSSLLIPLPSTPRSVTIEDDCVKSLISKLKAIESNSLLKISRSGTPHLISTPSIRKHLVTPLNCIKDSHSSKPPMLDPNLRDGELERVKKELKSLLKRYSHNALTCSENLAIDAIIKQIESYWVKLLNKKLDDKKIKSLLTLITRKDAEIGSLAKEKKGLEDKLESLKTELK